MVLYLAYLAGFRFAELSGRLFLQGFLHMNLFYVLCVLSCPFDSSACKLQGNERQLQDCHGATADQGPQGHFVFLGLRQDCTSKSWTC